MNIKTITYEFMGEETSFFIFSVGDILDHNGIKVIISSIREVGHLYNIYVKKLSGGKVQDKSVKGIKSIEGPELVLYAIKSNQIILEYFI